MCLRSTIGGDHVPIAAARGGADGAHTACSCGSGPGGVTSHAGSRREAERLFASALQTSDSPQPPCLLHCGASALREGVRHQGAQLGAACDLRGRAAASEWQHGALSLRIGLLAACFTLKGQDECALGESALISILMQDRSMGPGRSLRAAVAPQPYPQPS